MTIEDWRARVDEIDEAIVRLLNERAACALAIGRLKKQMGIALYQPERERYVIERVRALTREIGGALGPAAVGRLFERIIDEARGLEIARHEGAAESQYPDAGAQPQDGTTQA
jgi:chorismate mutase